MKNVISFILVIIFLILNIFLGRGGYADDCKPSRQQDTYWVSEDGTMSFYVHNYSNVIGKIQTEDEELVVEFFWDYGSTMQLWSIDFSKEIDGPYEHEDGYYLYETWRFTPLGKDKFIATVKETTYFEEGERFVFNKATPDEDNVVYPNPLSPVCISLGCVPDYRSAIADCFYHYSYSHVDSKEAVIAALNTVDYEPTDYKFEECESISITFRYTEPELEGIIDTVLYAVEYETEDMYALYRTDVYKVADPARLLSSIGKFICEDQYVIYERADTTEYELTKHKDVIFETGECRINRYFHNNSIENEYVILPDKTDVSAPQVELDKYTVSQIAAEILELEQYVARPYYDKYTDVWMVNIIEEEAFQKPDYEEHHFGLLWTEGSWDVVIDNEGNIVYCIQHPKTQARIR